MENIVPSQEDLDAEMALEDLDAEMALEWREYKEQEYREIRSSESP